MPCLALKQKHSNFQQNSYRAKGHYRFRSHCSRWLFRPVHSESIRSILRQASTVVDISSTVSSMPFVLVWMSETSLSHLPRYALLLSFLPFVSRESGSGGVLGGDKLVVVFDNIYCYKVLRVSIVCFLVFGWGYLLRSTERFTVLEEIGGCQRFEEYLALISVCNNRETFSTYAFDFLGVCTVGFKAKKVSSEATIGFIFWNLATKTISKFVAPFYLKRSGA